MPDNMHAEATRNDAAPSVTSLVRGIIDDAQQLIRQEIALARREVQEELAKAKVAAVSFSAAMAIAVLGGLMGCFMLAHLLHWLTGAADSAALPLWGCYAIVMGVFLAVAGALFMVAKNKMSQIELVPRRTVETLKENVQWIKNQT